MSIAAIFIGLALLIITIPVVAGPVVNAKREREFLIDEPDVPDEQEHYQQILLALRDLDFDHELGVVGDEDYAELRAQMLAEAAAAREAAGIEPAEDIESRIEAAVRARREQKVSPPPIPIESESESGLACYHCGADMEKEDKFCTICGSAAAPLCPSCGHQADPGDQFCAGCGTSLRMEAAI